MKRITLMVVAAAGLAFTATPSFAQSSYGGTSGGSYNNSVDRASARAERNARRAEKKARKERERAAKVEAERKALLEAEAREKQIAPVAASPSSATSAQSVTGHSSATNSAVFKNEDAIIAPAPAQLPTNCPSGTVPQANGTCMLQ